MDGGFVTRTTADWQAAVPELKRKGHELAGPCPLCGGTDRFHVAERDSRTLVGCRGCIDGLPTEARAARFGELCREVFRESNGRHQANGTARRDREEFPYHDADGKVLVTVVRHDLDAGKRIHREPKGVKMPAGGYPPYRLLSLLANPEKPVLMVEGERTAEQAHHLVGDRYEVTTSIGGAGKAAQTDLTPVSGRAVTIWPDADEPGRKHGEAVAELCHKAGAREVRMVETAGLADGWDLADRLPDGFDIETALNDSRPLRVRTGIRNESGLGGAWRFVPQREFMAQPVPEDDYAVDDLFPCGGVSLAVGKPKSGKSTGLRMTGVAISRGKPCFGRRTRQGKVLYCTLEERLPLVQRHFAAMGVNGDGDLYIHTGPAPADDAIAALDYILAGLKPRALIADPMFKLFRVSDQNDYTQVGAALELAIALAHRHNVMILGAHHGRKAGGDEGDSVLGSTATFGAVDTLMTFARSGDMRTVSTIQRDGKDMPETVLTLDPETGWLTAAGTRRDAQAADAAQAVYEFIGDAAEPLTMKEVVEAMDIRATVTRDAVHHLVAAGRLLTAGRGVKNDPKRFSAPQA